MFMKKIIPKKKSKTYNRRGFADRHRLTTNLPITSLCMAERTKCPVCLVSVVVCEEVDLINIEIYLDKSWYRSDVPVG